MRTIFLDFNSTTPIAGSVREAMLPFLGEFYGEPSSEHWSGRASQEAIEDARSSIATLLSCHPSELIFTSGATESINLALLGVARQLDRDRVTDQPGHLVVSALEHAAVSRCAKHLEQSGWEVSIVDCDSHGTLRPGDVEKAIRANTKLVSIVHANHEIGTVQPLSAIADICASRGVLLHTDASQSAGRMRCNVDEMRVDLLSLSGHKMYAPKGIGCLYVRSGVPIQPILFGDGQEAGLRPGTENVSHIVGLGQAARLIHAGVEDAADRLAELRDRFRDNLEHRFGKRLVVHGDKAPRLCNTLSFELPFGSAEETIRKTPEICVGPLAFRESNGSRSALSSTLRSLGLTTAQARRTIRVSLGWTTTEEEIERAADLLANAAEQVGA